MDLINIPSIQEIIVLLPAIVIGLTFHEAAHGYEAYRLGDDTAKQAGRLTLNPVKHVDPIGLLLLFFVGFGWAKPVPVNPYKLKGDKRKSMLKVSLAGPVSNLIIALISAVFLGLMLGSGLVENRYAWLIVQQLISLNVVLAIFNLLPIPPLDGSKIFASIFPDKQKWIYGMETYGTVILLVLLITGILGKILMLIISPIRNVLFQLSYLIAALLQTVIF